MIMRAGKYGISETHVRVGATTIAQTIPFAQTLAKKRIACCGVGVAMDYVRLSMEGVRRDSQVLDAEFLGGLVAPSTSISFGPVNVEANTPDQAKASYLVRMTAGDLARSSLYLAGVPDWAIQFDANDNPLPPPPAWLKILQIYLDELTSGWGFIGVQRPGGGNPLRPVTKAVLQQDTSLIGLVTTNANAIDVGAFVTVQDFLMVSRAYRSINGNWQVAERIDNSPGAGQATYYLRGTAGITPSTFAHYGNLFLRDKVTIAYLGATRRGGTTRKRGNRSLASPGRKLTRKVVN